MKTITMTTEKGKLELLFNPYLERYGVSMLQGTQKEMTVLLTDAQEKVNTWIVNQVCNMSEAKATLKSGMYYYYENKVSVSDVKRLLDENVSIMLSNIPVTLD